MTNIFSVFEDDDFEFGSTNNQSQINSDKKLDIVDFATIHKQDSEAATAIWPSDKNGPWIAGGACLRWFQGQPVGENDIDVFCRDSIQAQQVIDQIKSFGRYQIKFQSENAVTLLHHSKDRNDRSWTIQVITRRYFKSLQEVIDSFDITVCEIGTGGNEWLLGQSTARDIRERNLRFNLPLQPDAAKRLTKYWTYGYRPVPGTVAMVCANPAARWAFSETEDYQNAF